MCTLGDIGYPALLSKPLRPNTKGKMPVESPAPRNRSGPILSNATLPRAPTRNSRSSEHTNVKAPLVLSATLPAWEVKLTGILMHVWQHRPGAGSGWRGQRFAAVSRGERTHDPLLHCGIQQGIAQQHHPKSLVHVSFNGSMEASDAARCCPITVWPPSLRTHKPYA